MTRASIFFARESFTKMDGLPVKPGNDDLKRATMGTILCCETLVERGNCDE
jgi:hypothetical protein